MSFTKLDPSVDKELSRHFTGSIGRLGPYALVRRSYGYWAILINVNDEAIYLYAHNEWFKDGPWVEDVKKRLSDLHHAEDLKRLDRDRKAERLYEKAAEIVRNSK